MRGSPISDSVPVYALETSSEDTLDSMVDTVAALAIGRKFAFLK